MKKIVSRAVVAFGIVSLLAAAPARAQGLEVGAAGSLLVGIGNGGGSSAGLMGTVGVGEKPLHFRGDLSIFFEDGTPILFGANAIYSLPTSDASQFRPYVIGGLGFVSSGSDFVIGAGAGSKLRLTSVTLFGEAMLRNQFADGGSAQYLQLNVGAVFPLGR